MKDRKPRSIEAFTRELMLKRTRKKREHERKGKEKSYPKDYVSQMILEKKTGINQPKLSRLMSGVIPSFSGDECLKLLDAYGYDVIVRKR